jgi:hypothetical protein
MAKRIGGVRASLLRYGHNVQSPEDRRRQSVL